ncbi:MULTISPECIES: PadR family transcriptional regulator [Microbacterium]|uniref:PadR family transcriptional regulator n=1 Tax=Microbacterium TaxID=33882 RepID=UPI0027D8D8EC|nr:MULTISPECIES: PadR family transcriptional regulator [Microbacterium]
MDVRSGQLDNRDDIYRIVRVEPLQRVTQPTIDVLGVLLGTTGPAWGLRIIKETQRPAGTVYPILERLERQGWLTSEWEDDPARSGPRRRLYRLTAEGSPAARSVIAAHAAKQSAAAPARPGRLATS